MARRSEHARSGLCGGDRAGCPVQLFSFVVTALDFRTVQTFLAWVIPDRMSHVTEVQKIAYCNLLWRGCIFKCIV